MTPLPLDTFCYRFEVRTRRSDSVGNGHIPNAVLAAYFDDAREGLHRAILGGDPYGDNRVLSLVLGELHFRFSGEITFPGPLTVAVGVRRVGRSSLEEVASFFRDGECLTTAWCTMIKLVDRRPASFTAEERERAAGYFVAA